LQHPVEVRRRDEVPGRAHDMGSEDSSVVECLVDCRAGGTFSDPQREAPLRGRIVLRLDGTEPVDDRRRTAAVGAANPLVVQARLGNRGVHRSLHAEARTMAVRGYGTSDPCGGVILLRNRTRWPENSQYT